MDWRPAAATAAAATVALFRSFAAFLLLLSSNFCSPRMDMKHEHIRMPFPSFVWTKWANLNQLYRRTQYHSVLGDFAGAKRFIEVFDARRAREIRRHPCPINIHTCSTALALNVWRIVHLTTVHDLFALHNGGENVAICVVNIS